MEILENSARLPKTSWIGRVAGMAALAVAIAIAASPAAALAKKHKAADDSAAGTGVVDSAEAPAATCGATFSSCCTITSSGMYTMSADISTTITTGSCVGVSASNVTINMAGFTINDTATNPGTAVGVSMTGNSSDYLEGANGTISGFATGVSVNPGTSFSSTRNGFVDSVNVSSNTGAGILAAGDNVSISSISAGSNAYGVQFDGCTTCSLNFGDLEDNTDYGVWVDNSDYTAVGGTYTASNTNAGIYVGCATSPGGTCSSHGSNTKIFNAVSDSNKYGIYIDASEDTNDVAYTDGSSNTTDDAFARSDSTCAETNWFENTFTTVSPACINP
jgi:hypothetical protein